MMKTSYGTSRPTKVASYLIIVLTLHLATSPIYVYGELTVVVSGRVVDEYNRGIGDVEINVYSSDGTHIKSGSTSSTGYFAVGLTVGENYTLHFSKLGHFSKEGHTKVTKDVSLGSYGTGAVDIGDIVLIKALRLSSSVLSRVASPGDKLTFSFTVSNIGPELEIVEFSVAKPEGWSTRILDQIGEVTNVYLLPGVSMSLQLEVAIPLTSTGSNSLSVTASGKTSSTLSFTIIVETSSRPIISCQFPGKTTAPGESLRFQVRVKNPFGVRLRFRVAVDFIPDGWMAFVKSAGGEAVAEVTLDNNEFADVTVDIYVPREEVDGDYDVVFKASSSAGSENLTLLVAVQKIAAGIGVELLAIPPYLDAYAGSQAKFRLELTNSGGYDQLFELKIMGLPQDWRTWFEGSDGKEITRMYTEAGKSEQFNAVMAIPKETALGALDFTVSAISSGVTKSVGLTLNILGLYKIEVTNVNFYMSLSVGGEASYRLTVKNTGTEVVTNLDVATTGSVPSGFTVNVNPTLFSSLRPDEEATFTVTVTTQPDVNAGNYYVNFEVQSDQTDAIPFSLRIGVEQQMTWIYIGGALVLVAATTLFIVYRKFGRR